MKDILQPVPMLHRPVTVLLRPFPMLLLLFAVLSGFSCSYEIAPGECLKNDECKPGKQCVNFKCRDTAMDGGPADGGMGDGGVLQDGGIDGGGSDDGGTERDGGSGDGGGLLKGLGVACATADECRSTFCKDGVCCISACDGECQSCNFTNLEGYCNPVKSVDDSPECTGERTCNTDGGCKLKNGRSCGTDSTLCASGFCRDGVCCGSECSNSCQACNISGSEGQCKAVTNGDDIPGCTGSSSCNALGLCRLKTGQTCSDGPQCLTGICKDGFCCNSACDGVCRSCSLPGVEGTCGVVSFAEDPDRGCNGTRACDDAGNCKSKDGQACGGGDGGTGGDECLSGQCKDGVCCNDACTTPCRDCSSGSCLPIKGMEDNSECQGDRICNTMSECKLKQGMACTAASAGECLSGFCRDEVCCNNACTGICLACNLTGSIGECATVRLAEDPDTSCDETRTCDNLGACLLKNGQVCTGETQCASGLCRDGVCCNAACEVECRACNLTGNLGTCLPVLSAEDADSCLGTRICDDSGSCKLKGGEACGGAAACLSGFCKDGVCCDVACDGECLVCNASGSVGACKAVLSAEDADSCATTRICDSSGLCKTRTGEACTGGAQCLTGICKDGVCCLAACTGQCKSCATGSCLTVTNAEDDPECRGVKACDALGVCKRNLGQVCSLGTECASGFCKDGVCCSAACIGECLACNLAGQGGTCATVKNAVDPDSCTDTRSCDGAGACKLNIGQTCVSAGECLSGICKDSVCCNAGCAGTCQACNLTGKVGFCATVQDAEDPDTCAGASICSSAGACKLRDGQTCTAPEQCLSNICKDGVCCKSSCNGACQACNLAISMGTCGAVTNGEDPDTCGGIKACDGVGTCKLKDGQTCLSGEFCLSGFCKDTVCCDRACDGKCENCATGACKSVVNEEDFPECNGAWVCDDDGSCKLNLGQSCSTNGHCASRHCADEVCCNDSCDGECQVCDRSGSIGLCQSVVDAEDADTCSVTQSCNGAGLCKLVDGQPCTLSDSCLSTYCKDGRCCNGPCTRLCESCAHTGSEGKCGPVINGQDLPECGGGGQACNALSYCVTRLTYFEAESQFPRMVWTGSEYGVSWQDERHSSLPEIYLARIGPDGREAAAERRITYDANGDREPDLAWSGSEYGLAWRNYHGGTETYQIYFARLSAQGVQIGGDLKLTSYGDDNPYLPAIAWTGSTYGVAWERLGHLYFRQVSAIGSALGSNTTIVTSGTANYPDLAWGGGEYGLCWFDRRTGDNEIFFTRIAQTGLKVGTDIRLTEYDKDALHPVLAWSGSGYGVIWQDKRNSDKWEIYGAALGAEGQQTGGAVRLTYNEKESSFPAVVWSGSEFGLAWSDLRDGDGKGEIYFARMSDNGQPIGMAERISTADKESFYPSLAWTGSEYAIAWQDKRHGKFEIYFTRFTR